MADRRRAWRLVDPDLFRFTVTDLRELHVALMSAFEDAAILAPALNLDQVRTALAASGWDEPTSDEVLQRALVSLVGWRLLEVTQDHAAHYATPEEFERRNLQWSLTNRGEAAVAGLLHALDSLRHAVGLQPAVLDAIGDGLADLAALLAIPTRETDARIHLRLAEVEGHLAALVTSVRQFNGHLQRLLREDGTDDGVFIEVKRRTVSYLEEYVDGVERPQRRVAGAIAQLETAGVATLFDRALAGANLAPVGGGDPGPDWLAERARRWSALRSWFAPKDDAPPRIAGLLDIARMAIVDLLRVLERRWDNRRRSASVATDFRRLAALFATAPGDADAHRLFAAAFGLWPARHAHLAALDGEARAPTTPWTVADPVDVAPALRTTGTLTNRGQVRAVADPARLRALRQRAQAEALSAHERLRGALVTGGGIRLSQFRQLAADAFAELLQLLAVGLDAPVGSDGIRRALSVDGRVEVCLRDPGDQRIAVLSTAHGTLRGPDLIVSIALVEGEQEWRDVGHG
ncbi:MAG TPA: TIGR02677 family protein [Acidimicrobiales bacterium]|jgi:uncharacterized protein (TIGR02677 family)|nr:TIGR02677 family protein [Acidimicrobiales bacterium]